MKIRDAIEALLKENAELRQGALAHGLTLGVGFAGRDAGRAALKRLDDLDVRITEYLTEQMKPQPYDTYIDGEPVSVSYTLEQHKEQDDDRPTD